MRSPTSGFGTERTCRDVRVESAVEAIADVDMSDQTKCPVLC
jgi:hypothetical protein